LKVLRQETFTGRFRENRPPDGLTDLPYSFDCFLIQGMLKFFEFALWRMDEEERQKWLPELEKRWQWFNDQEWEIRNGKTKWNILDRYLPYITYSKQQYTFS
jgi:hypothetical protein